MTKENQNQGTYFSGETPPYDIILEILKKNHLEENIADAMVKMRQGKTSRIEVLYKLTSFLAEQKISERDFVSLVQKQLEITNEVAEGLSKDIKEKLLPLAIKVDIGETETIERKETATVKPARLIRGTQDINRENTEIPQIDKELSSIEENHSTKKEKKKKNTKEIEDKEEISETKETKRQSQKKDSYLEPIE